VFLFEGRLKEGRSNSFGEKEKIMFAFTSAWTEKRWLNLSLSKKLFFQRIFSCTLSCPISGLTNVAIFSVSKH
jgi:hypothetical protein